VKWALAALALAGCDRLFGLNGIRVHGDAALDAPVDAPSCVGVPLVADTFDNTGGTPCMGWGNDDHFMSTDVVAGGSLAITPDPDVTTTRGGCEASVRTPLTTTGVFVEVTQPATGADEYMYFAIDWGDGVTRSTWFWNASGTGILFQSRGATIGSTAFDPVSTRWLRIRAADDGGGVVGDYSSDAEHWTTIGEDQVTPPATVGVEFLDGTFAPEAAPSTARFDTLDVCP